MAEGYTVINPRGDGSIAYPPEDIYDEVVRMGGLTAIRRSLLEQHPRAEAEEAFSQILGAYKRVPRGETVTDIPRGAIPKLLAKGAIEPFSGVDAPPPPPPAPAPVAEEPDEPADEGGD